MLDYFKKYTIDALKTASKKPMKNSRSNQIDDLVGKVSQTLPHDGLEIIEKEADTLKGI